MSDRRPTSHSAQGLPASAGGPCVCLRDETAGVWLVFAAPRRVLEAWRLDEVVPALRAAEEAVAREGLYAAGFIAYEAAPAFDAALTVQVPNARLPLLWMGLFDAPHTMTTFPSAAAAALPMPDWQSSVGPDAYRAGVEAIRAHIFAGDTYQVNYTHRLRAAWTGDFDALYRRLAAPPAPRLGAFVDTGAWAVGSLSPELFFRLDGEVIESRPMKGTAPRGLWVEDDRARAAALAASEKDRAENVMITDMVRNDLGRVAVAGSVETSALFAVEQHPTVWQMTSTVRARTRAPVTDLFGALFPPASITGAPKRRAMEIIAATEEAPRGVYTGAIGYLAPGRRAQFNVAIRTLVCDRTHGALEYGVGGGIVWDSDPDREWEECRTKARALAPPPAFELLETLGWTPEEGYVLLERHLARLAQSARYFDFPVDEARVREALARAAAEGPPQPRVVRLTVSRDGAVTTGTRPPPPAPAAPPELPLAVATVDAADPFLYHKTTNRGVYARALAGRPGADDVILCNARGEVTESTVANVVVELDGVLCTPPVSCGLLAGTARAEALARGELRERVITVAEILHSPAVFLLNSVRGMWAIRPRG